MKFWTRRRFMATVTVAAVINFLFILFLSLNLVLEYGFNHDDPTVLRIGAVSGILEVIFLILALILDVLVWVGWESISGIKTWESENARFGQLGTLVRITAGVLVMGGLIYLAVEYLLIPS